MSFEYKKIMVVGATSGIGQALAEKMLNERPESKVIVVGRRKENLDSLAAKYEGRVSVEQFDVTDFKGIEGFAQK
jgi:NADP-dependent 3-hydroxy acid dehydrogenase YdfG